MNKSITISLLLSLFLVTSSLTTHKDQTFLTANADTKTSSKTSTAGVWDAVEGAASIGSLLPGTCNSFQPVFTQMSTSGYKTLNPPGSSFSFVKCSSWGDCPAVCEGDTWRKCPTVREGDSAINWNAVGGNYARGYLTSSIMDMSVCACSESQSRLYGTSFIIATSNGFWGQKSVKCNKYFEAIAKLRPAGSQGFAQLFGGGAFAAGGGGIASTIIDGLTPGSRRPFS